MALVRVSHPLAPAQNWQGVGIGNTAPPGQSRTTDINRAPLPLNSWPLKAWYEKVWAVSPRVLSLVEKPPTVNENSDHP